MSAFHFSHYHLVKQICFVIWSLLLHYLVVQVRNFSFYFGVYHFLFIRWNCYVEALSQSFLKSELFFSFQSIRKLRAHRAFINRFQAFYRLFYVEVRPFVFPKVKSKLTFVQTQRLIGLSFLVFLHLFRNMVSKSWQYVLLYFYLGFHASKQLQDTIIQLISCAVT